MNIVKINEGCNELLSLGVPFKPFITCVYLIKCLLCALVGNAITLSASST